VTALDLSRLLGKLNATIQAIMVAPLSYRREPARGAKDEWAKLSQRSESICASQGGIGVVEAIPYQLEWAEPHLESTSTDDRNECLFERMGSDLRRSQDRRTLVQGRGEPPCKLPRASAATLAVKCFTREKEM